MYVYRLDLGKAFASWYSFSSSTTWDQRKTSLVVDQHQRAASLLHCFKLHPQFTPRKETGYEASTERVTIFYCTYCLFVNMYYYCIFVVSFLRFLGGGCRVLSLGVDSRLCSFTMYFSLSSGLTILLYWSSRRLRWEWMDSAPCSPIMILQLLSRCCTFCTVVGDP